jgi:uncharacterized membrane protein (UPF0127 family)
VHFLEPLLKRSTGPAVLTVEGREAPLATTIETAFDSASRKQGLLGRDGLADNAALVIAPCSAVHTFAMRFPIDVVFARRDGRIIKMRQAMAVSRISAAIGAFAVIEMAAGTIARSGIRVGDRLAVLATDPPSSRR